MFSLRNLFAAVGRLTAAVAHSAELFEAANATLAERLGVEEAPASEVVAIEGPKARANGRVKA
jgi:hypothetical protein